MQPRKALWIGYQEGNFQWTLLPEWAGLVLGSPEWPLDRWARLYHVQPVKEGPHRAVYRVDTPEGCFYAKHYRAPRWTDRWRNFFRGCPARREWKTLLAVAQQGIPTLRPIGWGKSKGWRGLADSWLLTEEIPDAYTLDQFIEQMIHKISPAQHPRLLRRLLEELASFLAHCHEVGMAHRDLHAGNILIQMVGRPQLGLARSEKWFRFFLLDLQNVWIARPLDRQRSLENLAILASDWRDFTTASQRWRFWKTYCQSRRLQLFDLKKDGEQIDELGWQRRLRICQHRDRRWVKPNRHLVVLRASGATIYTLAGQDLEPVRRWAADPEAMLKKFFHRVVKLGHRTVLVEADWPPNLSEKESKTPVGTKQTAALSHRVPTPHFRSASQVFDRNLSESFSRAEEEVPPLFFSGAGVLRESGHLSSAKASGNPTGGVSPKGEYLTGGFESLREKHGQEMGSAGLLPSGAPVPAGFCRGGLEEPVLLKDSPGNPQRFKVSGWGNRKGAELNSGQEGFGPLREARSQGNQLPASRPAEAHLVGVSQVAIKRFRERVGWAGIGRYCRWTRAKRAWWAGHALLYRGILTPRPLALCEPAFRANPYYTYLVTQWIPQSENLHLWGWRIAHWPPFHRHCQAAQCAETLGRLIGRLHAFQITHGDLKMSNILVTSQDGKLECWLLDVEDIRIGPQPARRYRKDLVRLALGLQAHPWVSPTILCRFLQSYVRQFPPFSRPEWKSLWRAVQRDWEYTIAKKRTIHSTLL